MHLGTTYICVNDIRRSTDFYKALLGQEPMYSNGERWVAFKCGISLYNKAYDEQIIKSSNNKNYNKAYIDDFYTDKGDKKNNIVVFNFVTDDLKEEYNRLKSLDIGTLSEFLYVNVFQPYWYFNITDPDGNVIEITGEYTLKN